MHFYIHHTPPAVGVLLFIRSYTLLLVMAGQLGCDYLEEYMVHSWVFTQRFRKERTALRRVPH